MIGLVLFTHFNEFMIDIRSSWQWSADFNSVLEFWCYLLSVYVGNNTFAMPFPLFPASFIFEALSIDIHSISALLTCLIMALIGIAGVPGVIAFSMVLAVFKLSLIGICWRRIFAISLIFPFDKLPLIGAAVGEFHYAHTVSEIIFKISFVDIFLFLF